MRAPGYLKMISDGQIEVTETSVPSPLAQIFRRIPQFVGRSRALLKRISGSPEVDGSTQRFIAFNKRKWPQRKGGRDAVVLLGLFPVPPSVFSYSYVGNHLAARLDCQIEAYEFGPINPVTEKVYRSFGVRCTLTGALGKRYRARASVLAEEIFRGLKTKWDLVNLTVEDLLIGDQVYDTYLRKFNEPTVQLDDPRLKHVIEDALVIYYAAVEYLRRTKVECLITDDFSYINSGIITRLLFQRRVPIFMVLFGEPFRLLQIYPEPPAPGADGQLHPYPPAVADPYYHYREQFAQLSDTEKTQALTKAQALLKSRLSGEHDPLVRMHRSAYGTSSGRIFAEDGKPRILVLLHDFIDSPHGFRTLLFPDFFEWIYFLLEHAQETPFAWYVKPHPSISDPKRRVMNEANGKVIAELRARFPQIHFLPPETSNRQILEEGVRAMFTVHGTAGHEFAYAGIPVVNAGDNRHIAYTFNIHATSLDHYRECILKADRLDVEIDQRQIEEYFYMNYLHWNERYGSPVNLMKEELFTEPELARRLNSSIAFDDMMAGITPEREAGVHQYLGRFFDEAGISNYQ